MKKAEVTRVIKELSERKTLVRAFINGEKTKNDLILKGIRFAKPF